MTELVLHAAGRPQPRRAVEAVAQRLEEPDDRDDDDRRSRARRYQKRQNHARRRLMTSSSRSRGSSVPNRLGQGMKRRRMRSMRPRNAAISRDRAEDRPADAPAVLLVEIEVGGRAGQDRDDGRRAREHAPLLRELVRVRPRREAPVRLGQPFMDCSEALKWPLLRVREGVPDASFDVRRRRSVGGTATIPSCTTTATASTTTARRPTAAR